jgi:hypothetical protein
MLGCSLDAFTAHCRECLGVKSRLVWVTEKGPEVCCSGAEVRKLMSAGARVVTCSKGHSFLPGGSSGKAVLAVLQMIWERAGEVLTALGETDLARARISQADFSSKALLLGVLAVEAFGPKVLTPSFRTLIDNAEPQMRVGVMPIAWLHLCPPRRRARPGSYSRTASSCFVLRRNCAAWASRLGNAPPSRSKK